VGVETKERGLIRVNGVCQTSADHIYATGDITGFPGLASISLEHGRLAACHAFGVPCESPAEYYPYGIYTIPEISMVGKSEGQLRDEGTPYAVGRARFSEVPRGHIIGDRTGMLKLLFHPDDRRLLGVHLIGEGAAELLHIGQAVMAFQGRVDYFVQTVFNVPTLAEIYKVAASRGIAKLKETAPAS
jgi:NAD(P) transhydrogenase